MKPTVQITVRHRIENKSSGQATFVVAVFEGNNPTNVVPTIGHTLWLYIWEDQERSELDVLKVHHDLVDKVWKQVIAVETEIPCPDEAPDDGSIDELIANEIRILNEDVAPRLKKQGFAMIVNPNVDGLIAKRATRKPRKS